VVAGSWIKITRILKPVWQIILDDFFAVWFSQNHCAASITNELVGTFNHTVAFAGRSRHHLAGGSDFKSLLCRRLCLHLGHLAFLLKADRGDEPEHLFFGFNIDLSDEKPPRHALPGGLNEVGYSWGGGDWQGWE
jgi:hypothetical protein